MINRENSIKNSNTTVGVLTDSEVLLVDVVQGKRVLRSIPLLPAEPNALLDPIWQAGLTSVWVMPASTLSRAVTCAWFEQLSPHWVVIVHPDQREPARPLCALLWPKGSGQREGRRLTFIFPEYAGWNWTLADARSLLATVTYLDEVLARPIIDSPELVAYQLLTDLTSDQPTSWLSSAPVDLASLSSSDGTPVPIMESAQDVTWMRPLTWVEQRQKYLHKYTHFSLYLEACKGVRLGAGAPQYSSNGQACDGMRPGIWRVSVERAGSVFDGKRLPGSLDREWMSTPEVKCCRGIGYRVQVREGYYWSQSQELLKHWATTLWQAGERLNTRSQIYRHGQARANASRTIKMLAQLGIAIIAQEKATGGWSRPDWWAHIIGCSRANLFAHLSSLVRAGTMPVLVDRDAFWVVSNDPDPLTAVPGLVNAPRWRGYLVGYEAPLSLSREVREAFTTAQNADQVIMTLDALAGPVFP
jgi:hypothetical protein